MYGIYIYINITIFQINLISPSEQNINNNVVMILSKCTKTKNVIIIIIINIETSFIYYSSYQK